MLYIGGVDSGDSLAVLAFVNLQRSAEFAIACNAVQGNRVDA